MERSMIWSLSSPGGRLFEDRRITFNTRNPEAAPAPLSEQDRLYDLTVIDESGDVTERIFRERINQDRLHDALGALYPFWTADDTSSCDDCPVLSYADLAWRDQGDEREAGR